MIGVLVRLLPSQKARWRVRYPPSHRSEVPRETSPTFAFRLVRNNKPRFLYFGTKSFLSRLPFSKQVSRAQISLCGFSKRNRNEESVKITKKPFYFHEVPLATNTSLKTPTESAMSPLLRSQDGDGKGKATGVFKAVMSCAEWTERARAESDRPACTRELTLPEVFYTSSHLYGKFIWLKLQGQSVLCSTATEKARFTTNESITFSKRVPP